MQAALEEVGWAGAALYNRRTRRLIDGHLRKRVTKKGQKIPVLVGSWSAEQEGKILLTLDPIGAMAEADKTALDELLKSVRFDGSGFSPVLEKLLADAAWHDLPSDELKEPPDEVERAVELRNKWGTKRGQIWETLGHRIMCADCTEQNAVARLWRDTGRRFRMIWTDPPYGVNYGAKTAWMQRHRAQRQRAPIANDALPPDEIRELFARALRIAAAFAGSGAAIYATVPSGTLLPFFIAALAESAFTFKHALVWCKNSLVLGRGDYHYRHESILYGWREDGPHYFTEDRTQDSVFEVDRPVASPFHSTTKPVALIARMITNSSRPGELVYDPFVGSGSTLLAAHQLGRICYGVEISPDFVAVTLERLSALGLKPELVK
jgi:DNA modification methylase